VCLTAGSPGEKIRDSAYANLFATDGTHSDDSWSPSLSSTFFKRRGSLIMGFLDAKNAFVTRTTLELSTQSLNKDIPSFLTRSPSVPLSTIRIALSSLTEIKLIYPSIPMSLGTATVQGPLGSPQRPAFDQSPRLLPLCALFRLLEVVEFGVFLSQCSSIYSTSAGPLSTDDSTGRDFHSLMLDFPRAF
jgi:hypothetical protein